MEPTFNASSLPEKGLRVSNVASVRTPLATGQSAAFVRRLKGGGRKDGSPRRMPALHSVDRIDVEVRVTVQHSSWHPTHLPLGETPEPILIVRDTGHVMRTLRGQESRPSRASPPFMPTAFKATPSRALLDALLDLTFDAVRLKHSR